MGAYPGKCGIGQILSCNQICDNPLYGIFYEIDKFDAYIIAHSALEMERFVCNRATSVEIEKLSSKGIAVYIPFTGVTAIWRFGVMTCENLA